MNKKRCHQLQPGILFDQSSHLIQRVAICAACAWTILPLLVVVDRAAAQPNAATMVWRQPLNAWEAA